MIYERPSTTAGGEASLGGGTSSTASIARAKSLRAPSGKLRVAGGPPRTQASPYPRQNVVRAIPQAEALQSRDLVPRPITDIADVGAKASAMSRVLAVHCGSSNRPIGPFLGLSDGRGSEILARVCGRVPVEHVVSVARAHQIVIVSCAY